MDASSSSTSRRFGAVLLVVVLAAAFAWLAVKLNRASSELRLAETKLQQVKNRSVTEIADLRREVATLRKEKAALSVSADQPAASAQPAMNRSVDISDYVEAQPDYQDYRRRTYQEQIFMRYGDLKSLNLPPDKLQRLQELLFNQLAAPGDAQAAAQKQGISFASPEFGRLFGEAMQQANKEIWDFLGKAGYADLQAAERRTQSLAAVQGDLGMEVMLSGDPLSADQARAMADTLAQLQRRPVQLGASADQELALQARAAQILTPRQLEVFQRSRALQLQGAELQRQGLEAAKKALGHDITSWGSHGP